MIRTALEEHMARCRRCRVVLDTARRTLKIAPDVEPLIVLFAVSGWTALEPRVTFRVPSGRFLT